MREAVIPGYRLSKARPSTKILISLALTGLFLGLLSSAVLSVERTGIAPAKVAAYYRGSTAGAGVDALLGNSRRPVGELAEITHLHILGGSMLLFLLCHLLSICDVDDSTRTTLYIVSFTTFLLTFGLPWLIEFVHPAFAWLFGPSISIFVVSLMVLTLIPLREMWGKGDALPSA